MQDIAALSEYGRCVETQMADRFSAIKRSFLEEIWERRRKGGREGRVKGTLGEQLVQTRAEGG